MNIDKQIEEMARILCGQVKSCNECTVHKPCLMMNCATILTNKGYRKAIVVVRDIFNDLNEMWHKGRGFINYSDLVRLERLHEQKYTEGEG